MLVTILAQAHNERALFPPTHTFSFFFSFVLIPIRIVQSVAPSTWDVGRDSRALPGYSGDAAFTPGCVEVHVRSRAGFP